ncbi:MAG: hypothetical protein IPO27_06575 [Bacteroidetes bacterium]|nr:hypothetical protein [Bacteroidota bacterium]
MCRLRLSRLHKQYSNSYHPTQTKNSELSQEQKQENKIIGRARIAIEHMIGGIKISRIVNDKYRGRMMHREDTVMLIACGLYNLKNSFKNAA